MSIVKSLSVHEGDMFYIKHNSDNFTIIDCCLDESNYDQILQELKIQKSGKGIVRFISTHPDDDHIRGIDALFNDLNIPNFYCVENAAYNPDGAEDFSMYCKLRDGKEHFYIKQGCERKWMNLDSDPLDQEQRGSSGINILWPLKTNEHYIEALRKVKEWDTPNNISPIIRYKVERNGSFIWFGDMEQDFQEKIKDIVKLPKTDIVFAPHHGRESGHLVSKWLQELEPKLIVVGEAPSEHLCYYCGYDTITQNTAGNITFVCENQEINIYVENGDYNPHFKNIEKDLSRKKYQNGLGYYIGTIICDN